MATVPVILDTDIGSDIDDAVALAYLLRQPRCELLGVTTVSGECEKRASLANAVCRAAGRESIPIHVGVEGPLLIAQRQPRAPHTEALGGRWPHAVYDRGCTAIEFLRNTIRARPGEVTLLAIGPLTNVGLLFAIDPEIPSLLKQLVIMGGRFFSRSADGGALEWNILCDPHAAAMVFAARPPRTVAVGLDVTERCRLDASLCRDRFAAAGGPLAPVADMAEVWFRHSNAITFHDPLAAALIFEPDVCELLRTEIVVETISTLASGQTLLRIDPTSGPHEAATTVDSERFFEHYFSIVSR